MAVTIFSKIISKEIPADIVYEDDELLAFNDINPQAPVHILIIPKKQIATINDLDPEDSYLIGKMTLLAKSLAEKAGVITDGYRLVMNCNARAGQSVFHIHMHLLAGRDMEWPPG